MLEKFKQVLMAPFKGPDRPITAHSPVIRFMVISQTIVSLCAITALIVALAVFSDKATERANINRAAIQAIQHSRTEITLANCLDQNKRNQETIGALRTLRKHPNNGTIQLINTLVPVRNCAQVAQQVTDPR